MASESTAKGKPHVLIIGAGLSGLTLAQCLRKREIPFEIFDRDTDITARHGWAISVHTIMGDIAESFPSDMGDLREAADHLIPLKLEPQICFYGRGDRLAVENSPETPCLRLNRGHLRRWLATKIPVQWSKRLCRVEEDGSRVIAHFEDGTTASGDILVGADGVKSVAREYLLGKPSTEVLNPIPQASIWAEATLSGEAFERQLSLGHSAYVFASKGVNYVLWVGLNKVNEDLTGDYYWHVGWEDSDVTKPDHWLKHASKKEKYERALEVTADLEPRLRELIELTPVDRVLPKQMMLWDAEITSLPVGGVTLIGDAIHPMTPFRGEGGMNAIKDGLRLAAALSEVDLQDPEKTHSVLDTYQREVIERGVAAVRLSRNATKENQKGDTKIMSWGHEAKPKPEEKVLLEDCKP